MKNKIKLLSMLGISTLLIGGLASCGESTTNTTGGSTGSTSGTSGTNPNVLDIEFWGTFNKSTTDDIQNQIDLFESIIEYNEGVKVNFKLSQQGGYDEIKTKINQGFTSGIYPTIAVAYPDHVAEYLHFAPDCVVNFDDYINDPEIGFGNDKIEALNDDYTLEEGYVKSFVDEGKQYAVEGTYSFPFLKSTEVLVYNKSVVESIMIPELNNGRPLNDAFMKNLTWDQFITILEYIKDNNEGPDGFNVKYPAFYDSDSNFFITKMIQKDIPFIENGNTAAEKILYNNPEAKDMVREIKDLHDRGLITTKGVEGQYGSNYFTTGDIIFDISSSGGVGYNEIGGGVEIGTVKVPYENAPSYVSQGPTLTLLSHPKNADDEIKVKYAFRLIKFLTSADVNAKIATNSGGYIPVNTYSYETPEYDYFLYDEVNDNNLLSINARCVINDINGQYYNLPTFKGSATVRDNVGGLLTKVLTDQLSIDDAFEEAYNYSVIASTN